MEDINTNSSELARNFAENYMDKLFYFCIKKTGSADEAEELTQDIALNVLSGLARRDVPANFQAWVWRIAVWSFPLSLAAMIVGWIFTEMGRQPWVVYGEMFTRDGVSPLVPAWHVVLSLGGFTLAYLILAVIEVGLLARYVKAGPPEPEEPDEAIGAGGAEADEEDRPMAFAY